MHLVNTEPLTAVQHASDRRFTLTHPSQFPFTHIARHSGTDRHFQSQDFGPSVLFGGTCLCFLVARPHKSALRCGFVFNNCVENARCTAVFVSVYTRYRTDNFLCDGPLKLVTSSNSGAK